MQDWGGYILGFIFFFASHSIPTRPGVKSRFVDVLGARGFTLAYSALSTFALAVLILSARTAPQIPLWHWAEWHNHLALTLMLVAMIIVALALGRPNPLSFGGSQNDRFDPKQPGLIGWLHHPLLAALFLWSLAHMIANGDLAHVIMFGCFALFSFFGRKIINRRKIRQLGEEEWQRLAATRREILPSMNGMIRVCLGVLLYGLILWAHEPVIGISPLP
ncbi:NnrU family protein [Aliiroseovarius sp. KMU-50]|uniref:NnrU family protein n=1 Tax=Aliiroseovarius salicola TaxID=3009082 RepID=A0ABT4W273_9RHOB|nr:NnrU family protein [Aliiroseovarius sp. KMU-50]MDA5094619.1 NnrU family protein [Aliiroseovarius sp. KMU-50]